MSSTFADAEFDEPLQNQLTLGTASLLGIFFALVMVCGIFFGFGYSFGRRSFAQSAVDTRPVAIAAPAPTVAKILPPVDVPASPMKIQSAVMPNLQTAPIAMAASAPGPMPMPVKEIPTTYLPGANRGRTSPRLPDQRTSMAAVAPSSITPALKMVLAKPSAIHPVEVQPAIKLPYTRRTQMTLDALRSPTTPSTPYLYTPPFYVHARRTYWHRPVFTGVQETAPLPREALVVQIAAMSRQDDAEVLASSLRKRGFATSIHNDTADLLYHVQVGPYQRNVAMAARQRLIASGYNAILK